MMDQRLWKIQFIQINDEVFILMNAVPICFPEKFTWDSIA